MLAPIPPEIEQLNYMERRLTAQVYTFQRIVALPSGGQAGAKGIAISFSYNVAKMVQSLPRPPKDSGIITVVCNVDRAQPITDLPPDVDPNRPLNDNPEQPEQRAHVSKLILILAFALFTGHLL